MGGEASDVRDGGRAIGHRRGHGGWRNFRDIWMKRGDSYTRMREDRGENTEEGREVWDGKGGMGSNGGQGRLGDEERRGECRIEGMILA